MMAATRWRGTAALTPGRLLEELLREAISRLIESTAPAAELVGEMRRLPSSFPTTAYLLGPRVEV